MKKIAKRLKSKTVWLGIATQAIGVLVLMQANYANLNIPPEYAGWGMVALGTAIGILREFTKKPVDEK